VQDRPARLEHFKETVAAVGGPLYPVSESGTDKDRELRDS
jgi:hypothetical protein